MPDLNELPTPAELDAPEFPQVPAEFLSGVECPDDDDDEPGGTNRPVYIPTEEQIAAETAAIRATWTPRDYIIRAGHDPETYNRWLPHGANRYGVPDRRDTRPADTSGKANATGESREGVCVDSGFEVFPALQ